MRRTSRRARLVVCAVLATASAHAQSLRALERVSNGPVTGYVIRPQDLSAPRPVTVYLHGVCGNPANGCPRFRDGVWERSWLLCPSAPGRCESGGASWDGTDASGALTVRRITRAAEMLAPGSVDREVPGVLIGFSQGSYVARGLLRREPGRWRAVAFVAGFIQVTRAELEAAGVRRAVFAAGRRDLTRRTLEETARRLAEEGFPARFVDLGAVGHTYVPSRDVPGWRDALAWLEGA